MKQRNPLLIPRVLLFATVVIVLLALVWATLTMMRFRQMFVELELEATPFLAKPYDVVLNGFLAVLTVFWGLKMWPRRKKVAWSFYLIIAIVLLILLPMYIQTTLNINFEPIIEKTLAGRGL